jgi:hypothetical protein
MLTLIVSHVSVVSIDFIGPFSNSFSYLYILVAVDYVSKCVEVVACKTNDHRVILVLNISVFKRHYLCSFWYSSSNY